MDRRLDGRRREITARQRAFQLLQRGFHGIILELLRKILFVVIRRFDKEILPLFHIRELLQAALHERADFRKILRIKVLAPVIDRQIGLAHLREPADFHLGEILSVQIRHLLDVHLGGRMLATVQRERLDKLFAAHLLAFVARIPAEQRQIVHHRVRQEALVFEIADERVAVAFAVRLAGRVDDHRQMAVLRDGGAQAAEHHDVAERVLHMVVAADDMRHFLRDVVDDVRDMEHGAAVAADDHDILHAVQRLRHVAFDQIMVGDGAAREAKLRRPFDRLDEFALQDGLFLPTDVEKHFPFRVKHLQILETGQGAAAGRRLAFRRQRRVIDALVADDHRRLRMDGDFSRPDFMHAGHVFRMPRNLEQHGLAAAALRVFVRIPLIQKFLDRGKMVVDLRRLIQRFLVEIQPEPIHHFQQRLDRLRRRTLQIRVFDSEKERPLLMAREQPVEDGRADIADMDLSRRRRGETDSDTHRSTPI